MAASGPDGVGAAWQGFDAGQEVAAAAQVVAGAAWQGSAAGAARSGGGLRSPTGKA